jgi:hypothetical protein
VRPHQVAVALLPSKMMSMAMHTSAALVSLKIYNGTACCAKQEQDVF